VQLTTALPADAVIVQADPVHIGHALLHLGLYARDTLHNAGGITFELTGPDLKRESESGERISELLARLQVRTSRTAAPAAPGHDQPSTLETTPALDIVSHLLTENDARFHIESGSETFAATLEFPVVTVDAQSVALRTAPPRGHETVLVVEDDAAVRMLMQTTLERHGYRVMVAEGPADALAQVRTTTPAIDLVIVDLVLPDGGGEALAASMQSLRTGVRVLYISGQPDRLAADQPTLKPAGILLAKPFTANRLLLGVRQALDTTPAGA
jgi:two-component system cell cycle sensor histidine kinase/response regulator CckA